MAIHPASSASVGALQATTSGPGPPLGGRYGAIVLSIRSGMVRANSIRDLDNLRPAPSVGRDPERRHRWVAVGEGHDVGHVRAAPLVDGLLVIPDDAQFDLRAGQQLDQPFLGRIDVLVLVHDQVTEPGWISAASSGRSSSRTARTTCWPYVSSR